MAYVRSGFPRLPQLTDVPAAAATQRKIPSTSLQRWRPGRELSGNKQGQSLRSDEHINLPDNVNSPDIFMLSGPDLGFSVQSRGVTPCECHLYKESGLFHLVVGKRQGEAQSIVGGVTGAGSSRWVLQARAWALPQGAPNFKLVCGKEEVEHG